MASTQVTLQLTPGELQIISEALRLYTYIRTEMNSEIQQRGYGFSGISLSAENAAAMAEEIRRDLRVL